MTRDMDAFVHAPPGAGWRAGAGLGPDERGGKSVDWRTGCCCGGRWEGPAPIRAGDIVREALWWSWCRALWGFRPTAQSGRAGSGCFDDVEVGWTNEVVGVVL